MEYPKRKNTRLESWNYSENAAYFITICTQDRACILSRITSVGAGVLDRPRIELTKYGEIVEKTIYAIDKHYSDLSILKYVIMPNHIHLLVLLTGNGASRTPPPTKANETIPNLISTLKRFSNKAAGRPLWQRSHHDHVIRN